MKAEPDVTTFHFKVELSRLDGDPQEELSRMLRYWAGSLKYYDLSKPHTEALMDSTYSEAGTWQIK